MIWMVKINLGCGKDYKDGWVNLDHERVSSLWKVDIEYDLDKCRLPFANDSVDEVCMNHVLEHLNCDLMDFFNDLWRVMKPDGVVRIRVPHASGLWAWADITHRRAFTSKAFRALLDYTDEPQFVSYTRQNWRYKAWLHWRNPAAHVRIRHFIGILDTPISAVLNISPFVSEYVLANYVGGIQELEVELKPVK